MAQDLSKATGIEVDSNYLNGKLKDKQTRVNAFINQDIVQFFQKLMDEAGFSPNDLDDNETNGYQFIDALISRIRGTAASTTEKGTVEKATLTELRNGTSDKFPDAATLSTIGFSPSPTLLNGWGINGGGIGYGIDGIGNRWLIIDSLDGTSATNDVICELDASLGGGPRRFFTGLTDSYTPVAFQIDSSGFLRTNSRQDFICCAIWITP